MSMRSITPAVHAVNELATGIHRAMPLPDARLGELWESIVVDESLKTRLLAQAVCNFTVRSRVSRTVLPLHGLILLTGRPGTGKTSLAKGLAHRVAQSIKGGKFQLIEVEPHALTSSGLGKSQRAVTEFFSQAIAETATQGPTIVLLDEVETLAADRAKLSLEANPVDVHRATDAVLVQLDVLAETHPQILFVATSNFPQAIDEALVSRADLVVEVPMPGKEACERILADCLRGLSETFPPVGKLVEDKNFSKLAAACEGLDGRAIRKVVANAISERLELAVDPNKLAMQDLMSAARNARAMRVGKASK